MRFITNIDRVRLSNYIQFKQLFKGNHWHIFEAPFGHHNGRLRSPFLMNRDFEQRMKRQELIYVVANFAGLISKVAGDFLFGEDLTLSAQSEDEGTQDATQEQLDEIWKREQMQCMLWESALTNSAKGDAVFKVDSVDGKAKILDISVENWFPEFGWDKKSITAHNFVFPFIKDRRWHIFVERHTPGKIENKVFRIKGSLKIHGQLHLHNDDVLINKTLITHKGIKAHHFPRLVQLMDVEDKELDLKEFEDFIGETEPEVDTGLEFMPVTHIPNWRCSDDFFGQSDYADIETLFQELNNRISQTGRILDKHGDPKLAVPKGILDENSEVERGDLELIEIDGEEGFKPQYITWDANLEAQFSHIEHLKDMILMLSETDRALFGLGKDKIASGIALKLKLLRTMAKIARKRKYYDLGIKQIMSHAIIIEQAGTGTPADQDFSINIKWQDGLPEFDVERNAVHLARQGAGVQSQKTTISSLNPEWDDERVEQEIEDVENESVPAVSARMGQRENTTPDDLNKIAADIRRQGPQAPPQGQ